MSRTLKPYLLAFSGFWFLLSLLDAIDSLNKFETLSDIAVQAGISFFLSILAALFFCGLVQGLVTVAGAVVNVGPYRRRVDAAAAGLLAFPIVALSAKAWLEGITGHVALGFRGRMIGAGLILAVGILLWSRRLGPGVLLDRLHALLERLFGPVAFVVGLVLLLLAGCLVVIPLDRDADAPPAATPDGRPHPNIVLITFDAFTASASELWGNAEETTPNLSHLAAGGSVFDAFYGASNMTTPSTASMVSGTYPWTHRALHLIGFVQNRTRVESLVVPLHAAGYETATFSANWYSHPEHQMLNQGWDVAAPQQQNPPGYLLDLNTRWTFGFCRHLAACELTRMGSLFPFNFVPSTNGSPLLRRAVFGREWHWAEPGIIFDHTRQFLAARTDPHRPLFLWVHYFPPHDPYTPDPPFLHHFLKSDEFAHAFEQLDIPAGVVGGISSDEQAKLRLRYEENLLFADDALGKLLEMLRQQGLTEQNTIVVISADHGESFSRGYFEHTGPLLTQELIRLPLVVRVPGGLRQRITTPLSQIDLAPTLLDYAGVATPASMTGRSFKGLIEGAAPPTHPAPVFSMNFQNASAFGNLKRGSVAVIDGQWKLVKYFGHEQGLVDELHNLTADPHEDLNVIASNPDIARRLEALITEHIDAANEAYHKAVP